jgi:hypothetical protein
MRSQCPVSSWSEMLLWMSMLKPGGLVLCWKGGSSNIGGPDGIVRAHTVRALLRSATATYVSAAVAGLDRQMVIRRTWRLRAGSRSPEALCGPPRPPC